MISRNQSLLSLVEREKTRNPSHVSSSPQLKSGKLHWYALKDKQCLQRESGEVALECELVYNCVRASLRTIKPREMKVLEEEQRFQRKVSTTPE